MASPASLPPYQPRPLKWGHLVGFAAIVPQRPPIKHPAIDAIAQYFIFNLQRINWMLLAPTLIGDLTIDIQRSVDAAEFKLTKELLDPTSQTDDHPRHDEIIRLANEIFHAITREKFRTIGTAGFDAYVLASLQRGTQPVLMLEDAPAAVGLEAMLMSAITGTWTAIETMAGDLWETALNVHPDGLSELKGSRKQFLPGAQKKPKREGEEQRDSENLKTVPLSQILQHRYDLREKMGTALRGGRRFDHLPGIREAYGLAFYDDFKDIEAAITDRAIDGLNAVRNLIVHRSGVVDPAYDRQSTYLHIPHAAIGAPILLDGESVKDLMIPRTWLH